MDLNKLKQVIFNSRIQVVVFDDGGMIVDSCDTIVNFTKYNTQSIFELLPFFDSLREVLTTLPIGEPFELEWVNIDAECLSGFFDFVFRRIEENGQTLNACVFLENSENFEKILDMQQDRNNYIINIEKYELNARYIKLEYELLASRNKELERLNEFKTNFYAKISHELRNPINGIVGVVNLLSENRDENTTNAIDNKYIRAIQNTSKHLSNIVNDLLDLSKMEAKKMTFDNSEFNLEDVLANVSSSFEITAKDKNLGYNYTITDAVPKVLCGDATRLSQILYNLIGNAFKFTANGSIDLRITLESIAQSADEDQDSGIVKAQIKFEVTDTGIGVAENRLKRIFEQYEQAEVTTGRFFGGTGLGLHISKQLVELQQGQIGVISELNKGSRFFFTMPFEVPQTAISKLIEGENELQQWFKKTPIKILIAEDNQVNQLIMQNIFKTYNTTTDIVENGQEALKLLEINTYDLLISDLHMPVMDGYQTIQNIRLNTQKPYANIPALAVTGSLWEGKDLIELGFDDFMTKPFQKKELLNKIRKIIAQNHIPHPVRHQKYIDQKQKLTKNQTQTDNANTNTINEIHFPYDNNNEIKNKFLKTFLDQSNLYKVILYDGMEQANLQSIAMASQQFKTCPNYLNLHELEELVVKIERSTSNKIMNADVKDMIHKTIEIINKTNRQILKMLNQKK